MPRNRCSSQQTQATVKYGQYGHTAHHLPFPSLSSPNHRVFDDTAQLYMGFTNIFGNLMSRCVLKLTVSPSFQQYDMFISIVAVWKDILFIPFACCSPQHSQQTCFNRTILRERCFREESLMGYLHKAGRRKPRKNPMEMTSHNHLVYVFFEAKYNVAWDCIHM